jgi:UDP-3-O-[3-hydroxymyristoyl] glucosamine N-acyltransferase
VFLSDPRYRDTVVRSRASVVIAPKGVTFSGKIVLAVDDPYAGYAIVATLFEDRTPVFGEGMHPSAVIDPSVTIDPSTHVGPHSVIGRDCTVGEGTSICAGCVIERGARIGRSCRIDSGVVIRRDTVIGDRVIIEAGAVIGSDGFGNARIGGRFMRIPPFGIVIIEDDVWIGANVTIDRGSFGATIIHAGARLDNLVHIAHNVVVGEDTAMAAQVGVSGSTTIGKRVLVGGQAGFVGHITIGDDAFIGAKAGISKNVDAGAKVTGYPARDFMTMRRIEAAQARLPEIIPQIRRMRAAMDSLQQQDDTSAKGTM